MIGKLKDITFTRSGEQIISFSTKTDFTEAFDTLKDFDVDVEIKRHRQKRSLDANAYCWVLCEKIADKLADDSSSAAALRASLPRSAHTKPVPVTF